MYKWYCGIYLRAQWAHVCADYWCKQLWRAWFWLGSIIKRCRKLNLISRNSDRNFIYHFGGTFCTLPHVQQITGFSKHKEKEISYWFKLFCNILVEFIWLCSLIIYIDLCTTIWVLPSRGASSSNTIHLLKKIESINTEGEMEGER